MITCCDGATPNGTDLWLVYDAFHAPWQSTLDAPRLFEGVVRHATVGTGGVLDRPARDERRRPQLERDRIQQVCPANFGNSDIWSAELSP